MYRKDHTEYWDAYYKFWDQFVKDWFTFISRNKTISEVAIVSFGKASCINVDELPEPYLGSPDGELEAVFLNLNPGMSDNDLEEQKFYSCKDIVKPGHSETRGWLIKEFVDKFNISYKAFIKEKSPLDTNNIDHHPELCGVEWWLTGKGRKGKGSRINWVKRIYGKTTLDSRKVFAPELCPFHSKKWEFDVKHDIELVKFVVAHVLEPAMVATNENELPFAIAVGKAFLDILKKIENNEIDGAKASVIGKWCCEQDGKKKERVFSDDRLTKIWPQSRGAFTVRSYYLYDVTINGVSARLLVTYAPGGNTPPSEDFDKDIEKEIRACTGLVKDADPIHFYFTNGAVIAQNPLANDSNLTISNSISTPQVQHRSNDVRRRDTTKYNFNGRSRLKQQEMVEAVIAKHIADNPEITLSDLESVFPRNLQGPTLGCVVATNSELFQRTDRQRFRSNTYHLADGTDVAIVSQWGRAWGTGNIPKFLERARALGYKIEEISPKEMEDEKELHA